MFNNKAMETLKEVVDSIEEFKKENVTDWEAFIERHDGLEGMEFTPIQAAMYLKIRTSKKTNEIVFKRYLFWYELKKQFPALTLVKLGELTGGQDHSTVSQGRKKGADKDLRKTYLKPYIEIVDLVISRIRFKND